MIVSPLIYFFLNHCPRSCVPARLSELLGVDPPCLPLLGALCHCVPTVLPLDLAVCKKQNAESALDMQCA